MDKRLEIVFRISNFPDLPFGFREGFGGMLTHLPRHMRPLPEHGLAGLTLERAFRHLQTRYQFDKNDYFLVNGVRVNPKTYILECGDKVHIIPRDQSVRPAEDSLHSEEDGSDAFERLALALERVAALPPEGMSREGEPGSIPAGDAPLPPEALSKEDAARFLGVSVPTIENLIRTRKIQYVQLGSQRGRVIPVEALRKLLKENLQLTGEELQKRRGRR